MFSHYRDNSSSSNSSIRFWVFLFRFCFFPPVVSLEYLHLPAHAWTVLLLFFYLYFSLLFGTPTRRAFSVFCEIIGWEFSWDGRAKTDLLT
jgi:hypothetical protein